MRPPGFADALGQAVFERCLAVLVLERDAPFAARVLVADRLSPRECASRSVRGQQLRAVQHLRVRDRGAHVIEHQALVERMVLAGRVLQHALIERRALVPQPAHAVRALSAVLLGGSQRLDVLDDQRPVPSLVNTSASMLSGELYEMTWTRRTPPRIAASIALAFGSMPSIRLPFSRGASGRAGPYRR